MKTAFLLLIITLSLSLEIKAQSEKESKYKTIYSQSFSSDKSTKDFEFSDESKWLISKNGKSGKSLKCLGQGEYKNAHGGPSVVAVLKSFEVSDFVLEMDIQQNGKDYGLLDFCIFFGIKDREHYCYAQIAADADKHKHNIFMIDGDQPKRIGQKHNEGVIWGINKWHHVKVERNKEEKKVKVYFNDELILESNEDPLMEGFIGFGSSSSALKVDNIKLIAPEFDESNTTVFN